MDLLDRRRPVDAARIARSRVARAFKELRARSPGLARACGRGCSRRASACAVRRRQVAAARRSAAAPRCSRPRGRRGSSRSPWRRSRLSGAARLHRRSAAGPVGARATPTSLARPAVAIVGSRAATPYALGCRPHGSAGELADRGSRRRERPGAGASTRRRTGAAWRPAAPTVAVLGSGLDRIYPAEHATLAARSLPKGAAGQRVRAWRAAAARSTFRCGTVSSPGSRSAVVVVEASEKSGSLITARCALEQGRDVMAVPGQRPVAAETAARTASSRTEQRSSSLRTIFLRSSGGRPLTATPRLSTAKSLHSDSLLAQMEAGEVYRLDELMELTGVTGTRLLPRLMELELAGLVTEQSGSGFARERAGGNVIGVG